MCFYDKMDQSQHLTIYFKILKAASIFLFNSICNKMHNLLSLLLFCTESENNKFIIIILILIIISLFNYV